MDHGALKAMIRDKLRSSPLVAKALEENPSLQAEDTASILQHLEAKGLIEDMYADLEQSLQRQRQNVGAGAGHVRSIPPGNAPRAAVAAASDAGGGAAAGSSGTGKWTPYYAPSTIPSSASRQLCLRLHSGRSFLDFLEERDAAGRELQWHISFGRHRLRTRFVPAATDMAFDEVLHLELPPGMSRSALLMHNSPVHLLLLSYKSQREAEDPWDRGAPTILCSHFLEWRHCLAAAGPLKQTIELKGIGRRAQLAVGVLSAETELLPAGAATELLPDLSVGAQLRAEEQRKGEVMRRVFEDLDRWWAEYHHLYASRHIRLFAQTENRLFLPVTSFITPLEAGRALDTPYHALRWVALFGTEQVPQPENTDPHWHTLPALWARGRGTVDEKAILLCCLLLGYSMDAWCCLGSDSQGRPHSWVIVRELGDSSKPADVVCWDVSAVARIRVNDARYLAMYTSVDVLFNHRRLLVCHASNVARTSFDFTDVRTWLPVPMDDEALTELKLYPTSRRPPYADLRLRLWGLPADAETLEEAIESRLSGAVRVQREAVGLRTMIDEHLAQILHVALVNCEMERLGSSSYGTVFEGLVRRICTDEEVLQAVPVCFNHLCVSTFWPAISERQSAREMLQANGSLAIRARVVPYPEDTVAVWAILAIVVRSG